MFYHPRTIQNKIVSSAKSWARTISRSEHLYFLSSSWIKSAAQSIFAISSLNSLFPCIFSVHILILSRHVKNIIFNYTPFAATLLLLNTPLRSIKKRATAFNSDGSSWINSLRLSDRLICLSASHNYRLFSYQNASAYSRIVWLCCDPAGVFICLISSIFSSRHDEDHIDLFAA